MPPKINSRYLLCTAVQDRLGNLYLTERAPFRFAVFSDNRLHVAEDGDTLFNLSGRFFGGLDNPSQFWWAIGDFQPDPVIDPTRALAVGSVIVIPSVRTLLEVILNEDRREEFTP